MIVNGNTKTKQLYVDGKRIYMVFHGEDLIYNCYAIPEQEIIRITEYTDNMGDGSILSNTEWNLNF